MSRALKILLIEDNPADATLLQEVLAFHDVRIVWASSLAEAADVASNDSFDAALLDLNLTDSLGLATISRAAQTLHDIPIIVLTGMEDEEAAMKAVSLGAQDYLVKGQNDERVILRTIRYAIDRKQAQEVLRTERDFVSTVLDTAGSLVVVLDADGRIIRFNRACQQTTGYSFGEVVGRRPWEFLLLPQDAESVKQNYSEFLSNASYEMYWVTRHGEQRLIAWANSVLKNGNGAATGLISAGIDITERRRAERLLAEHMRSLEQLSGTATRLLQPMPFHDLLRFTAEQLERIAGAAIVAVSEYVAVENTLVVQAVTGPREKLRCMTEILSRDPVGLSFDFVEETRDLLIRGQLAPVEGGLHGLAFGQLSQTLCRKLEEELSLGSAFAMPFVLDQDFLGMTAVLTDRSEGLKNRRMIEALVNQAGLALKRKRAEEALEKAKQELEQRVLERTADLSRAIDSLQMEVEGRILAEQALLERSHKLRELASELTMAEQRERRRMAKILHDELQQLLVGARFQLSPLQRFNSGTVQEVVRTVNDLLGQSVEISRTLTSELSPPILYEGGLVPALQWLARWTHQKHGLNVQVISDQYRNEDEPDDVRILLFESVRELLLNAVKHSGAPLVQVHISDHCGALEVAVKDGGKGFDPSQLTTRGLSGGHGLFGVRERIESFGGSFSIDSRPGNGSRFVLQVPIHRPASEIPTEADQRNGGRKIRVLLADDHAVVRHGLTHLLRNEPDIEVISEASDGEQALTLARELLPDVVLMDVSMPNMNGIEATRMLSSELPEVKVVGLSMFDEAERAAQMRAAGAVSYISKSAESGEVVKAIRGAAHQASH